jgi:hypothetical protein
MFKHKINFITRHKNLFDILEKPHPSIKKTPEWFKNMHPYRNNVKGVDDNSDPNSTIKKCMPVFDCMTAGYYIPLICDVWVENDQENLNFKWSMDDIQIVSAHNKEGYNLYPIPDGYMSIAFKWINPWIINTNKNYSCLFTHPMHYDDLPFKCLPAIVDTDKHPTEIHFIFFLKKGFRGLIPKGTPIIQVIPFKRQKFKATYDTKYEKFDLIWNKAKTVFFDRYKLFFRSPKKYDMEQKDRKCPFSFIKNK